MLETKKNQSTPTKTFNYCVNEPDFLSTKAEGRPRPRSGRCLRCGRRNWSWPAWWTWSPSLQLLRRESRWNSRWFLTKPKIIIKFLKLGAIITSVLHRLKSIKNRDWSTIGVIKDFEVLHILSYLNLTDPWSPHLSGGSAIWPLLPFIQKCGLKQPR